MGKDYRKNRKCILRGERTKLVSDNIGISRLIEFFMVLTVFLIIISGFYAMINIYRPPLIDYTQEEVIRLSNALISDSGLFFNTTTEKFQDNWEEQSDAIINNISIMSSIGLAINKTVREDNQTCGILSYRKIENLSRIEYENARTILGLRDKGYDVNITFTFGMNITTTNQSGLIRQYGENLTLRSSVHSWERIVLVILLNNTYIPATMAVYIAKRG